MTSMLSSFGRTLRPALFGRVRNQRELTRAHDCRAQLPLVHRTCSRNPARQNLRPFGHERHQELHVLVVDVVDLVRAELAHLPAAEHRTTLAVLALLTALGAPLPTAAAAPTKASLADHRSTSVASNRSSSSMSLRCPSPGCLSGGSPRATRRRRDDSVRLTRVRSIFV